MMFEEIRKQMARELHTDWRQLERRVTVASQRLTQAVSAYGTTLTDIYGIGAVGAATILGIVGDVRRFPNRGHFAAFN
ncbi:MAG: transposase, partial [Actinomycetota bacterium]|nr:transposase [Actinomycetota bacterium]